MPRRGPVALILAGTLALTACAGDDDDAGSASDVVDELADGEATAESFDDGDALEASATSAGTTAGDRPAQGENDFDIGVIGRDVIIEMRVVLSSDDIQRSVASIMAAASTLGGGVASSDVDYGTDGGTGNEGYALLVVKVPPESVDRLLSGLGDTGVVQSINQSARDVTEQLVDLDVRIDNARRSVANVRDFMDRTENLNELVTLESELTRRQTELEQLEAQQRNLADRVALSTVTIEVVPSASVPEPVDEEGAGIGDALRSGATAFVAILFGIAFVLAASLPFLISAALLALIAWLVTGRRGARHLDRSRSHGATSRDPSPDTAADAGDDAEANEPEDEPVG